MGYDVFCFRGHGNNDPGATGNGYKEVDIAQSFVDRINELLKNKGLSVLTNSLNQNNYEVCLLKGQQINRKFGYEIHLNSGGGTGIEILVPAKEKYLSVEQEIINNVSRETGLANRGLKSRNYNNDNFYFRENGVAQTFTDWYKVIREAWDLGISLSIIELGFIDNVEDVKKLLDNRELICRIIANAILRYCEKPLYSIEQQKEEQEGLLYRVQVGAFKDKENALKLQKELINKGYKAIIK